MPLVCGGVGGGPVGASAANHVRQPEQAKDGAYKRYPEPPGRIGIGKWCSEEDYEDHPGNCPQRRADGNRGDAVSIDRRGRGVGVGSLHAPRLPERLAPVPSASRGWR